MEAGNLAEREARGKLKIVHFADLHLGVEEYGNINPKTGLSTRLEDFLMSLDELVDYSLEEKTDLVLFCGDAYKSREPSQTQQREFARRINRLTSGGIPIFLLAGNHDMSNAAGRATAIEIFDALSLERVYVANRPGIHRIPTAGGTVQIVSLPWLRRSTLLSKEETKGLDFDGINQKLQEVLTNIIATNAGRLDTALPAILAAHVWVTGAKVGSESMMNIGQEHTLLLSSVAKPSFDYVALGHIHKHQVLSESPPVVYSGSLERINFSEEKDDKGFYVVDIESGDGTVTRRVSFDFHPVKARRFLSIDASVEPDNPDPTATVIDAVSYHSEEIRGAIVRLNISMPASIEGQLKDGEIRDSLKEAYHYNITRDIKRESRIRLGNQTAEEVTPIDALRGYLETRNMTPERKQTLIEYGKNLIAERNMEQK